MPTLRQLSILILVLAALACDCGDLPDPFVRISAYDSMFLEIDYGRVGTYEALGSNFPEAESIEPYNVSEVALAIDIAGTT